LVIAHRGASSYAPENTMAAFRLAKEQGADAIEFDVKLTGDGQVIVLHDQTLDRTTDGHGPVDDCSMREIRKLDAGLRFGSRYAGERIPSLEQVLDAFGEGMLYNIELTNYAHPFDALPMEVVRLVMARKLTSRTLISSFNPVALMRARGLSADLPVGLLLSARQPRWWRWMLRHALRFHALHLQNMLATSQLVRAEVLEGRLVNVWTVNGRREMARMLRMGASGLITDCPDRARAEVDGSAESWRAGA
jgi:glycerophosphoryl diester phosphodiesterase